MNRQPQRGGTFRQKLVQMAQIASMRLKWNWNFSSSPARCAVCSTAIPASITTTPPRFSQCPTNPVNFAMFSFLAHFPPVHQIVFRNQSTALMTTTNGYVHLNRLTRLFSLPSAMTAKAITRRGCRRSPDADELPSWACSQQNHWQC